MRSPAPAPDRPALLVPVLLASFALAGCGHPATRAECDQIFDHSAEIELRGQHLTDPKIIAERTAAARAAKGEELIGACVGRRITRSAMDCVRKAATSDEVDRCLD